MNALSVCMPGNAWKKAAELLKSYSSGKLESSSLPNVNDELPCTHVQWFLHDFARLELERFEVGRGGLFFWGNKCNSSRARDFCRSHLATKMATGEEAGLFSFLALVPPKKQSPTPNLKPL
jgi:hypothetical protein